MEYLRKDGTKVIVEGDMVQYGQERMRKKVIGANYVNGITLGGYLSSFNGSLGEESIGISSGLDDIINAKIGDIKDAYELLKLKINNIENANIFTVSCAILDTVDEYFNGFDNIGERMNYYLLEDEKQTDNKISDLKGTGAAMCVERAALAQNLLKSLGINSFFKTSGIVKNNNREVHSYNLIEYKNRYYIFDSSIPNLINGQINPLIAEIDEETFNLLSCPISDIGISVTVSHYNPYRDMDVTITYDSGRKEQLEVNPLEEQNQLNL